MTPNGWCRGVAAILLLALSLTSQATETTIAFGSCLRQWQPQPVWDAIRKVGPDAFIFVGDNVYTDTGPNRLRSEPQRIGSSYDSLASNPGFQSFRKQIPIYPIFEVTASGMNSAGAGEGEQNRYRTTEDNFRKDHFGLVRLFEEHGQQMLSLEVIDMDGRKVMTELIALDSLRQP
jgi:alkaline phosphatase D